MCFLRPKKKKKKDYSHTATFCWLRSGLSRTKHGERWQSASSEVSLHSFCLPVCVYVCACAWMHAHMSTYACAHVENRGQCPMSSPVARQLFCSDWISHWTWSSPTQRDLLASKLPPSTELQPHAMRCFSVGQTWRSSPSLLLSAIWLVICLSLSQILDTTVLLQVWWTSTGSPNVEMVLGITYTVVAVLRDPNSTRPCYSTIHLG